jgi:hypothetical protein
MAAVFQVAAEMSTSKKKDSSGEITNPLESECHVTVRKEWPAAMTASDSRLCWLNDRCGRQ